MTLKMCPCGNSTMHVTCIEKSTEYNGINLSFSSEKYVCPHCGIEAGTIEQTSAMQKCIAESYREKAGMLTGKEIARMRLASGLTQEQLALILGTGEKEVKGWESCIIQDWKTDKAIRTALKERGSYERISEPDD